MELHDYKSVTPVKKKRKKITSTAALVLCVLVFLAGLLIGRANSSGKEAKAAAQRIREIETEQKIEKERTTTEIETYKSEINRLKSELSDAKKSLNTESEKKADEKSAETEKKESKTEKDNEKTEGKAVSEKASSKEASDSIDSAEPETDSQKSVNSGGILRKLILGCLIVIIVACILFALSIIFKKNDVEDEYEDEDESDEENEYDVSEKLENDDDDDESDDE